MTRISSATKALSEISAFFKALSKWLLVTLRNPWRLANIRHVLIELTSTFESALSTQTDPSVQLLRSANQEVARGNLNTAARLYDCAISQNPNNADAYFLKASTLTYLRGDLALVDREIENGLAVNSALAARSGLAALNLRILGNDFAGMGHLALLDALIKLKKLGMINNHHIMIVDRRAVANFAYLDCWRKYLPIIVTNAAQYSAIKHLLSPIFENLSMWEAREGRLPLYVAWNKALTSWKGAPLLQLDEQIRCRGENLLREAGIPKDAWFVGLHVREGQKGGYLRSGADADINDYRLAIKHITSQGGWVVRMGRGGTSLNGLSQVWDYANSQACSDWMDVFLWASCRFFIGTSSGPISVPPTFGKPVIYTNAVALGISPDFPGSIMIPKLLWSKRANRLLTFKEILSGPYGWTVLPIFDDGQTQLVPNSPLEILAAVEEMFESLDNPGFETATPAQAAFDQIRRPFKSTSQARIANSFATSRQDLLQ
jgi:putative glycosyltransferase (TIGR04372 family)